MKNREDKSIGLAVLIHVFVESLKLLHPFMPFVTEKIWTEIFSKESIHIQNFPTFGEMKFPDVTEKLAAFNSAVWNYKKESGLSLNAPLEKASAPKELEIFEKDLKLMHNIQNLGFDKETTIG